MLFTSTLLEWLDRLGALKYLGTCHVQIVHVIETKLLEQAAL